MTIKFVPASAEELARRVPAPLVVKEKDTAPSTEPKRKSTAASAATILATINTLQNR